MKLKLSFKFVCYFIIALAFEIMTYYCALKIPFEAYKEYKHIAEHPALYYILLLGLTYSFYRLNKLFEKGVFNELPTRSSE